LVGAFGKGLSGDLEGSREESGGMEVGSFGGRKVEVWKRASLEVRGGRLENLKFKYQVDKNL